MKSIIEDFDHIASRLNQIEQEKRVEATAAEAELPAWNPTWCYVPTPAHSIEDVYCGFTLPTHATRQ